MTVNEFYDYITQHMTAEEALKKLLVSQIAHYKQHKEQHPNGDESPFFIIIEAAKELGWTIAVEKGKEDSALRGLSIGTKEYLDDVLKG